MSLALTYTGQHKEFPVREEGNCLAKSNTFKAGLSESFEVGG